ncbi:hypothetical protein BC937DRAFT_89546 [Endogone sp. FLAS-F59071]|nr:hypothetical protein BC937DRAFT_89546 [Endogone sp. FLAS-F59071]|eukprot:RUS17745.1 hypothetical protein BC937DRAFT_89546 [Endogone sp. FLAS-F59071]
MFSMTIPSTSASTSVSASASTAFTSTSLAFTTTDMAIDTATDTVTYSPRFIGKSIPKVDTMLKERLHHFVNGALLPFGDEYYEQHASFHPSLPGFPTKPEPSAKTSVAFRPVSLEVVHAYQPRSIAAYATIISSIESFDVNKKPSATTSVASAVFRPPSASSVATIPSSAPSSSSLKPKSSESSVISLLKEFGLIPSDPKPNPTFKKPIAATVRKSASSFRPPNSLLKPQQTPKTMPESINATSVQKSGSFPPPLPLLQPQPTPNTVSKNAIATTLQKPSSTPLSLPSQPQVTSKTASKIPIAAAVPSSASLPWPTTTVKKPTYKLKLPLSSSQPQSTAKPTSKNNIAAPSLQPPSSSSLSQHAPETASKPAIAAAIKKPAYIVRIPLPSSRPQSTAKPASKNAIAATACKSTFASSPRPSSSSSRPQLAPLLLEPRQLKNITSKSTGNIGEPLRGSLKDAPMLASVKPASRIKIVKEQAEKVTIVPEQTSSSKDRSLSRKRGEWSASDSDDENGDSRGKKRVWVAATEAGEKTAMAKSAAALSSSSGKGNLKRKRVDENSDNTGAKRKCAIKEAEHVTKEKNVNVSSPMSGSTPLTRNVRDSSGAERSRKRLFSRTEMLEHEHTMKENGVRVGGEKRKKIRADSEENKSKAAGDGTHGRKENKKIPHRNNVRSESRGCGRRQSVSPLRDNDRNRDQRRGWDESTEA